MTEQCFRGDEVGYIVTEAQGINDYNSIRFFANGNEVYQDGLEMIVYNDEEQNATDEADAGEAALAEREVAEELNQMEEDYEEIDDKCREYMITQLTENDLKKVREDMLLGDESYLDCIIRGNGFKPYGQYTNKELVAEMNEQNLGDNNGKF